MVVNMTDEMSKQSLFTQFCDVFVLET